MLCKPRKALAFGAVILSHVPFGLAEINSSRFLVAMALFPFPNLAKA